LPAAITTAPVLALFHSAGVLIAVPTSPGVSRLNTSAGKASMACAKSCRSCLRSPASSSWFNRKRAASSMTRIASRARLAFASRMRITLGMAGV